MLETKQRSLKAATMVVHLCTALSLAACGKDEKVPDGEVRISWTIGPRACEDAGTPDVVVTLAEEPTGTSWIFDCEDGDGVIPELDPGRYVFEVRAVTSDGIATYSGQTEEVVVRSGGSTNAGSVSLQAVPAEVRVQWNFGGPLCGQIGVTTVDVIAFDNGDTEEARATAECEVGYADLELSPGEYVLLVQARDAENEVIYAAQLEDTYYRGDEVKRTLELQECRRDMVGCP